MAGKKEVSDKLKREIDKMDQQKKDQIARRAFEAIAVIYSRRTGVQITVDEIRRKSNVEKEHAFE